VQLVAINPLSFRGLSLFSTENGFYWSEKAGYPARNAMCYENESLRWNLLQTLGESEETVSGRSHFSITLFHTQM